MELVEPILEEHVLVTYKFLPVVHVNLVPRPPVKGIGQFSGKIDHFYMYFPIRNSKFHSDKNWSIQGDTHSHALTLTHTYTDTRAISHTHT